MDSGYFIYFHTEAKSPQNHVNTSTCRVDGPDILGKMPAQTPQIYMWNVVTNSQGII
jgi:hypothetical protein